MGSKTEKIDQCVVNFLDFSILVVDDSYAVCRNLTRMLNNAGFTSVQSITDSRLAFSAIQDIQPRMLILDIVMPNVSGLQILDKVIGSPSLNETIVVVLSSLASEVEQLALKAGASAVVPKSATCDEIVRVISTSFRVARKFGTR